MGFFVTANFAALAVNALYGTSAVVAAIGMDKEVHPVYFSFLKECLVTTFFCTAHLIQRLRRPPDKTMESAHIRPSDWWKRDGWLFLGALFPRRSPPKPDMQRRQVAWLCVHRADKASGSGEAARSAFGRVSGAGEVAAQGRGRPTKGGASRWPGRRRQACPLRLLLSAAVPCSQSSHRLSWTLAHRNGLHGLLR